VRIVKTVTCAHHDPRVSNAPNDLSTVANICRSVSSLTFLSYLPSSPTACPLHCASSRAGYKMWRGTTRLTTDVFARPSDVTSRALTLLRIDITRLHHTCAVHRLWLRRYLNGIELRRHSQENQASEDMKWKVKLLRYSQGNQSCEMIRKPGVVRYLSFDVGKCCFVNQS
jgi:hypothetical protein